MSEKNGTAVVDEGTEGAKPEDRIEDLEGTSEEVTTEESPEDDATEEVDEGPANGKTYTKADIDKAAKRRQAALDRARKAEKELAELKKQHATEEQRLQIEAEEKAAAQAAKFKPTLVRQHVAYEMAFLGLNKDQISQVVKFVDMENIDVDLDDNSVSGVEEEVDRIKTTFPALFPETPKEDGTPKKKRTPTPKSDGGPKPPPEKPRTAKDEIVRRLRGES